MKNATGKWLLLGSLALGLAACNDTPDANVPTIDNNKIVVVTREGPTTYYETMYGHSGFEYDVAQHYADAQGKELEMIAVDSLKEVFDALESGRAHIAAAGLTGTAERSRRYHFSPSYQSINQYVLYRYGSFRPRKIEDLLDRKIAIHHNSSHELTMLQLSETHPQLKWQYTEDNSALDRLAMLKRGEVEHIVLDSNDYDLHKATFPGIGIAFAIKRDDPVVWMMGAKQSNHLLASIDTFFERIQNDGTLEALKERHYGHISHMRRNDSRTFANKLDDVFPDVESLIKRVALEEGIDWRLLAAISYQESHWNPRAKSPTGVRGLMMLTQITAREMGVTKRTDAEQSLRGGARYYHKLYARLPEEIREPDRTWMAMAAYNVGFGHLMDARKLTEMQDGNADAWIDVMKTLPLLRKKQYYSKTRFGYARGDEPVTYVQRIRNYYEQLAWRERNEDFLIALSSSATP